MKKIFIILFLMLSIFAKKLFNSFSLLNELALAIENTDNIKIKVIKNLFM